jgi:hypothetical protein
MTTTETATRKPATIAALNAALEFTGDRDAAAKVVVAALIDAGVPLDVAFDEVFGLGAYQCLSDDIFVTI